VDQESNEKGESKTSGRRRGRWLLKTKSIQGPNGVKRAPGQYRGGGGNGIRKRKKELLRDDRARLMRTQRVYGGQRAAINDHPTTRARRLARVLGDSLKHKVRRQFGVRTN